MDNKKYCIESRYEMWTKDGIQWTNWFMIITDTPTEDVSSLEDRISIYKKQDKESKQKLKHEYRVAPYVEPIRIEKPIKTTKTTKKKTKKKSDA